MFRAFHEKRESQRGFTLIELLVVILIIAILAAIAIPVFLRQREKGWRSQMQSALKNAATAEESFATENNGSYTSSLTSLVSQGLNTASAVTLAAAVTGTTSYCLRATHAQLTSETWYLTSGSGQPGTTSATGCP